MFCVQKGFESPTEVITPEQFWAIVKSPETTGKVARCRDYYEKGQKAQYDATKKTLPLMVFIGTFDEWDKEFENKKTGEKYTRRGHWRNQGHVRLNGLVVADYDHLEGNVRDIWAAAYAWLSDEDKARIVLVYVTPSGYGLKVVFMADPAVGNLIDNQVDFSAKLGLKVDEACKDGSRGAFMTTADDIIIINEEKLFTYENKEFIEQYESVYRDGHSEATRNENLSSGAFAMHQQPNKGICNPLDITNVDTTYNGQPIQPLVDAWTKQRFDGHEGASRHEASVVLARDLYIMYDRDKRKALKVLLDQPWVQQIIAERGENVERTVDNAVEYVEANERESAKKGKPWFPKISNEMKKVLGASESAEPNLKPEGDIYDQLPLDQWATELQAMAEYYPCLKELFVGVHPHKLPSVLFSSAALFGTLMTRAWYHFWFAPQIVRRLNYCIFIIGDPGAGKHMIEEFYKIIADPIIQADQSMTDALNRYKESRTERTTSSKAQKAEALKKPKVGIRVHPARTATGEFINHMRNAIEMIQGQPLNLHMLSFDSELDNVNKNNKAGEWKDREIMELKAFHNEEDGQMYANSESVSGMFNVYWNFIYTGTPYALHRKVNQRNFGTGMSTRLAVIPLPDRGKAPRHQEVIEGADETLRTWAYRLDKVAGEIPIEPLNDETYEWQNAHMEIAKINGDKADRMLLKRIPYYGIGITLPFILMRHWDEWEQHRTLSMDDIDKRFCRTVMEIQYRSQQFFFGEMAFHYFADQDKEFVVRRRTSRYEECFRLLPEEFTTKQFMECYACSQPTASRNITRLISDGVVERIDSRTYRKLAMELP